jgi:glycosyltransferase involved in cell wall biosynthesis
MLKFVGAKNTQIYMASDTEFTNKHLDIIPIPENLQSITAEDLMTNYFVKNNIIIHNNHKKSAKDLKVALISNYGSQCGIGTYSKFLYNEMVSQIGDYKIFIEKQNTYDFDNSNIPNDKIVPCWKRGESLSELIKKIKEYNPDIISIQHEFGLFSHSGYFLSFLTQLSNYRIIITMHSTFHHRDKGICEAAIPEMIVHLDGAKDVLKNEKQLSSIIYVIPHGCFVHSDHTRLWNFYKSDHTIIQAGFLFRYKGWEESIKIVSILKNKYPDVFLTGLCSENVSNKLEHSIYFQSLLDLISSLGVEDNIALIRGYQSDMVWDTYFRTNKVAIYPYVADKKDEVFGASGSARIAMSKGIPIVTSFANHFSDIPSIKASTPEEFANQIDKLFSDQILVQKQIELQDRYLENNSWKNVAKQYIDIFEK